MAVSFCTGIIRVATVVNDKRTRESSQKATAEFEHDDSVGGTGLHKPFPHVHLCKLVTI